MGLRYEKVLRGSESSVDSDWASCLEYRRSYTEVVFVLANCAITWEAKKERTVALSSTEAKYMELTKAAKEAVFLLKFRKEFRLGDKLSSPSTMTIRKYRG